MVKVTRRGFLKISGLAVLGLIAKPILDTFSKSELTKALSMETPVGKRWAMVIDLRACTAKNGCNKCIRACHYVHNVPDFGNPKDEIKWLWTVPYEEAFPEQKHDFIKKDLKGLPILVLCNHCDNPPCVRVCPTRATWKRRDGIIMQDYHRCIGCRYCIAACPYGSRSFNWRDPRPFIKEVNPGFPTRTLGVVEKCNFCEERLVKGLSPVCVEVCKEKALIFGNLEDSESEVRKILRLNYSIQRKLTLGTKPQVYYIL